MCSIVMMTLTSSARVSRSLHLACPCLCARWALACSVDFCIVVSSRGFADARSIRCASRSVAAFVLGTREITEWLIRVYLHKVLHIVLFILLAEELMGGGRAIQFVPERTDDVLSRDHGL